LNIYPVTINWIPGLPEKPYRAGVGLFEGVVMHQTATPGDSAASERAYESQHFNEAFVHEFIDPAQILQVANPAYLAYGAGHFANKRFIHLELCSAKTREQFEQSFDRWCQRAAIHLAARKLGVSNAQPSGTGTLWGHFQVSKYLGGTDHTDPVDYLKQWGKTWDSVLERVSLHYEFITNGVEHTMKAEDANKLIAILGAIWGLLPSTESKDEIHRLANELRIASGQPTE
jgi:N-acetylmuramoyl-L-alanine amidase CwlA